jgi:signal transduction histidine kinase
MSASSTTGRGWRRLSVRLSLWYAGLFSLSVAALFGLAYVVLAQALAAKDAEILRSKLKEYSVLYAAGGVPALRAAVDRETDGGAQRSLLVRLRQGRDEITLGAVPDEWIAARSVERDFFGFAREVRVVRLPRDAERELTLASTTLRDGTVLEVGRITNNRRLVLEPFRQRFGLVGLGVIVLSLGVGVFLADRALRPVREIAATARRIIATGDLEARVPDGRGHDDLDELVQLLNSVLHRNAGLVRALRESLDNAAHDLRTPLTRMRGTAEMALLNPDRTDLAQEALADCVEESDRVLTLLASVLDITAAEAGLMRLQRQTTDLVPLLREIADAYRPSAEDKGLRFELELPPRCEAWADPVRVRQVFANLVDNAVKYTPAGGRIGVSARWQTDAAEVLVSDTGPGIPAAERSKIWTRLYRGDASRSQRGLGLGLSLVKAIVDAHGGQVRVGDAAGGGAEFAVTLPVAPDGGLRTGKP